MSISFDSRPLVVIAKLRIDGNCSGAGDGRSMARKGRDNKQATGQQHSLTNLPLLWRAGLWIVTKHERVSLSFAEFGNKLGTDHSGCVVGQTGSYPETDWMRAKA
jgi:hypothetical protein